MAQKQNFNFSGGMNSKAAPLLLKDNESELVLNYILDKIGALWRRGGYGAAATVMANKNINGIFNFYDVSASTNRQLCVANNSGDTNGVIYRLEGGTWTARKTNDTASKRSRFFALVDYVFRVNGADVVASSADGQTWGTTNAPTVITPRYGAVFQDRAYVAHGNASNQSRVWFSGLPSTGTLSWDTTNDWFDVNPDDGDEITGLENNGNRLLIFKNRALYRWTFGQVEPDRLIGVGTSSQESIKTNLDLGITFFGNQNGVYAYTGNRPKLISRKIQQYIDAVSDWTTVYGGIDSDHYYLAVGNITVDGRTFTNAVLCYHISLDAWSLFTLGHKPTIFGSFIGVGSGEQMCMGATNGIIYGVVTFRNNPGNGTAPYTADNTTTIAAEMRSREMILSYPNRTNIRWIDVFALRRTTTNVFYDLDRQDNFVQLNRTLTGRTTNYRIPVAECNSIRIKVTDTNTSTEEVASVIEGFNLEHEPKEKRDEEKVKTLTRARGFNSPPSTAI